MPRAIQFKTKDGKRHTIVDHSVDCVCTICKKDYGGTTEKGGAIFNEQLVCKKCSVAIIKIRGTKPDVICKKDELFTRFAMKHAVCVGEKIAKIIDKHGEISDSSPEEFPNITKETLLGPQFKIEEIYKSGFPEDEERENEWESSLGWDDEDSKGEGWKNGQNEQWSGD